MSALRRNWAPILVLHLAVAFCGVTTTGKGVFLPSLLEEFDLSRTAASALLSANVIVDSLVALFVAFVALKYVGLRTLAIISSLMVGAGALYAGFANHYLDLLVGYTLMTGGAISSIVAPLVATNWYAERRGLALGLILAGTTTAGAVLTQVTRIIIEAWGWRAGYQSVAFVLIVVMPPLLWLAFRGKDDRTAAASGARSPISREDIQQVLAGLKRPAFWAILAIYIVFLINTNTYFLHFVSAMTSKGYDLKEAVSIMSVLFLLAAAAKLLFGWLGDRIPVGKALAVGFVLSALGAWLIQFADQKPALLTMQLAYGLSYSAPLILLPMLIGDTFGRASLAIFTTVLSVLAHLVAAGGPVFAGFVYDATRSYDVTFQVYAGLLLVAAAVAAFAVRPGAHRGAPAPVLRPAE